MKYSNIFDFNKWIILLQFFVACIIFNIIRNMDTVIGRFGIASIPLGFILFLFLFRFKRRGISNKSILISILIAFITSAFLQFFVSAPKNEYLTSNTFPNPLYEEFLDIAKRFDLDLTFAKTTWKQRGPIDYLIHPIFSREESSVDILIIGDSSISWGVVPQVIEQLTGKEVSVYAYEGNAITEQTAKVFKLIADYFLKENGILILSFDNSNLWRNSNTAPISKASFLKMTSWKQGDFNDFVQKTEKSFFQKHLSLESFQFSVSSISEYLSSMGGLSLKSASIHTNFIEPFINPKLSENKRKNMKKSGSYIRWDQRSITIFDTTRKGLSFHSKIEPTGKYIVTNDFAEKNSLEAIKIFQGKRAYMVPLNLDQRSYARARSIYQKYYSKNFDLIDLGKVHPKTEKFPMQWGSHMVNEGGLMKSILIGQQLNEMYRK